jgi:hypothetical protein
VTDRLTSRVLAAAGPGVTVSAPFAFVAALEVLIILSIRLRDDPRSVGLNERIVGSAAATTHPATVSDSKLSAPVPVAAVATRT